LDEDPELFFPDDQADPLASELAAVAVCTACPVLAVCQAEALASRERFGVWGGLTEGERRQIFAPKSPRRSAARSAA